MKISVGDLRKIVEQAMAEAEPGTKKPRMSASQAQKEKRRQDQMAWQNAEREKREKENPVVRLPEYDGFKPGEWLKLADGTVARLEYVENKKSPQDPEGYNFAWLHSTFESDFGQRAEMILRGARKATPEEVADAEARGKKHSEWLNTQIDSSREGT